MPRVKVILDNGHEVMVEGANSANWTQVLLISGAGSGHHVFEVLYQTENERKVLARFDGQKIAGYVFSPC